MSENLDRKGEHTAFATVAFPGCGSHAVRQHHRFVDVSYGASSPADSRLSFIMLRFLAAFAALFALSSATSLAATVRVSGAL